MSEVLVVTKIGKAEQDVNGMVYRATEFETLGVKRVITPKGVIMAHTTKRRSTINCWQKSYLEVFNYCKENGMLDEDGNAQYKKLKEDDLKHIPDDYIWEVQVGQSVLGSIVSREVEEYPIVDVITGEERIVHTYSRVILGDTDHPAYEQLVRTEFERNNHPLIQKNEEFQPKFDEVEDLEDKVTVNE